MCVVYSLSPGSGIKLSQRQEEHEAMPRGMHEHGKATVRHPAASKFMWRPVHQTSNQCIVSLCEVTQRQRPALH